MHRPILRVALICLVLLAMVVLGLVLGVRTLLVDSLPDLDGRVRVAGIASRVTVERDALGVPRIRAGSIEDACFAQGFVHGQDRFFQMDTMRRLSSGRLSEMVGSGALGTDRSMRTLGMTEVAEEALERLPERHRAMIASYTMGVNAGLQSLGARPPEYWALRVKPEPWRERDCMLVALSMAWGLEMGHRMEATRAGLGAVLPAELVGFLTPEFGLFDAPIDGTATPGLAPIPEGLRAAAPIGARDAEERAVPEGSNGFVVSGAMTRSGGAMLASDMHLGLDVPNTWYRVQMEWGDKRVVGVSLPGVPSVAVGSNGDVAWGFTNTTGDHADYILIETDPDDPMRYRTPDGWERFVIREEWIGVKGAEPVRHLVRETKWGAVVDDDTATGMPRVLKWMMLEPGWFNLNLFDMIDATDARRGADIAASWYGPSQNAMIADKNGGIAWTVTGAVPRRVGFDGRLPVSWADGARMWDGVIEDDDRPRIVDPASGYLVTANNRTLEAERARVLGTHWANGSRAGRIMELLDGRTGLTERDVLAVQLDTNSAVHAEYAEHLRDLVPAMRDEIPEGWDGEASAESRVFPLVDRWAGNLRDALLRPVMDACGRADPGFRYSWFMDDDWVMRLLRERPASWVPDGYDSWEALAAACVPKDELGSWGERNRANIRHRLSPYAPEWAQEWVGAWLDMARDPLPGAGLTVRVQTSRFGASERLVVTPGREEEAVFHMPGGQSGHFLSGYYRAGHEAWVEGVATGLVAGEPEHTMVLEPRD